MAEMEWVCEVGKVWLPISRNKIWVATFRASLATLTPSDQEVIPLVWKIPYCLQACDAV
jgi:hypothetical protein